MKAAIFEQAVSQYAPYAGPIQMQSNALSAIQKISPRCYEELLKVGTVTVDGVSGLRIGYRRVSLWVWESSLTRVIGSSALIRSDRPLRPVCPPQWWGTDPSFNNGFFDVRGS